MTQTDSEKKPVRKKRLKLDEFSRVVSYILTTILGLFIASFTFSWPLPIKIILGSYVASLALTLVLTLDKRFSKKQLTYIAALIPSLISVPVFLSLFVLNQAILIGWSMGYLLIVGTAVLDYEKKKLPWPYFLVLGIVLSQLFLPFSLVYKSVNNTAGLLDPFPVVEVYGNVTNSYGQTVNFTDSTHHSRLFSVTQNYFTGISKFDVPLPNRMNYTVSMLQGTYPPYGSSQSCQPVLVLNIDSWKFPFNIKC